MFSVKGDLLSFGGFFTHLWLRAASVVGEGATHSSVFRKQPVRFSDAASFYLCPTMSSLEGSDLPAKTLIPSFSSPWICPKFLGALSRASNSQFLMFPFSSCLSGYHNLCLTRPESASDFRYQNPFTRSPVHQNPPPLQPATTVCT